MYIPFSINKDEIGLLEFKQEIRHINLVQLRQDSLGFLRSCFFANSDILKGDVIKQSWLPDGKHYDFFISYSHHDEDSAIRLYQWLQSKGVSCFLDACYWNSSDELLKTLDSEYCLQPNGFYSYKKRNYSTSLVHSMLSMAILDVLDNSDFAIFIESDNSLILNYEEIKHCTLSPWIFQELKLIQKIDKKRPAWLKGQLRYFSSGGILNENAPIQMAFGIPSFPLLTAESLNSIKGFNETFLQHFISRY